MNLPITPYQITIWKLSGPDDAVDSRVECYAETYFQAVELFDMLTRGIRGHYRAWLIDLATDKEIQSSAVTY